jgi:hypothetical protein
MGEGTHSYEERCRSRDRGMEAFISGTNGVVMITTIGKALTGMILFVAGYMTYTILRRPKRVAVYEVEPEDYGTPVGPI